MYTQIKMYQRDTVYRKQSLGKQNGDMNASLHMALGIFGNIPCQQYTGLTVVSGSHDINVPLLVCILCLTAWD